MKEPKIFFLYFLIILMYEHRVFKSEQLYDNNAGKYLYLD